MTTAPGSLGEEASRLAEAIVEWARGAADGGVPIATGAEECTLCPVCQLLSLARRANPETFSHLADATTSFLAAVRTVVDAHGHDHSGSSRLQRIDLDGE